MELKTLQNQVIQNVESSAFGINVNAKAFSILAELYKNPIEAIVRELSTNAADSHVEAGNYNPFDVILPTSQKPVFIIRDYGVGLSEYDFETVYFRMFESTKDSNNNLNGCLGLGKASSLAYNTKTFTIESWKNGKYLCYLCFIGNSGMPEYTLLNKNDSDEESGVRISINVKAQDCQAFIQAATNVYQWFEVKPNTNINLQYVSFKRYSDNFSISDLKKPIALMSGVAYPIENYFSNINRDFYNTGIVLYFNPGEIEFTPSRESIKYTDFTKNAIKNKIELVKQDIKDFFKEKTKDCKSQYQIAVMSNNYQHILKFINNDIGVKRYIKIKKDVKSFVLNRYVRNTSTVLIGNYKLVKNDLKTGGFSIAKELSKDTATLLVNNPSELEITTCDEDYILASSLYQKTKREYKKVSKVMKLIGHSSIAWKSIDLKDVTDKFYIIRSKNKAIFNGCELSPKFIRDKLISINFTKNVYGFNKTDEKIAIQNGFININDVYNNTINEYKKFIENNIDIYHNYKAIYSYASRIEYILNVAKLHNINKSNLGDIISYSEYLDKHKQIIDKFKSMSGIAHIQSNLKIDLSHIDRLYECLNRLHYYTYGQKLILLGYCQEKKNV